MLSFFGYVIHFWLCCPFLFMLSISEPCCPFLGLGFAFEHSIYALRPSRERCAGQKKEFAQGHCNRSLDGIYRWFLFAAIWQADRWWHCLYMCASDAAPWVSYGRTGIATQTLVLRSAEVCSRLLFWVFVIEGILKAFLPNLYTFRSHAGC